MERREGGVERLRSEIVAPGDVSALKIRVSRSCDILCRKEVIGDKARTWYSSPERTSITVTAVPVLRSISTNAAGEMRGMTEDAEGAGNASHQFFSTFLETGAAGSSGFLA